VRYATERLVVSRFLPDKLEVVAGVKKLLLAFAKTDPNVRVMDGRFHVIEEAIGAPRGRTIGLPYLRTFIEEMKKSGFVADALKRSGQGEAAVAPPG
jgi:polar amino acid transport system substrate-binding protein